MGRSGQVRLCAWRPLRKEVPPVTAEPWVSVDDIALHLGMAKDSVYRAPDADHEEEEEEEHR